MKGSSLWPLVDSLLSTGLLITDNGCQGEQNETITRQQRIDSKIYRIELEVIVAL